MICGRYVKMLEGRGIKKEQLQLIIRDNATNVVKDMQDAGYPNLGCFAHTLQLVVHEWCAFTAVCERHEWSLFAVRL